MDPDTTLTALCEALRDKYREGCWDALEALNDWLAKGGAFPNKVRAVPLSDMDLLVMSIGILGLIEVAKKGLCPIPGLDDRARSRFAETGLALAKYIENAEHIAVLNHAMKVYAGFDPNKPL